MKQKKGFIALSSVLMLGAIFLSLSISIAFQAIGGAGDITASVQSRKAQMLAEDCVEYALTKLQSTLNYQGNESILLSDESCTIKVITGEGNTWRTIQTEATTTTGYTHRIEVIVEEISPVTKIASYRSVVQF